MGMMIQRVQRILLWILVSLMFFFCTRQSRIELSAPADLECIWACLENQFKTSFIYLFLNKKWWVSFMLKLFLKFCSHPSLIDSSKFYQPTCHMCKQSHTKQAYKKTLLEIVTFELIHRPNHFRVPVPNRLVGKTRFVLSEREHSKNN